MKHRGTTLGRAALRVLCIGALLAASGLGWTSLAVANVSALDFASGSSQRVTFGTATSLGLQQFTLELWFMRQGTGTTASSGTGGIVAIPLLTKGRGEAEGSNVDMNWFLGIRGTDNKLAADFEDMAGGVNHPVIGTTTILNNVWYHAAATYDGTTWRLYLNGVLDGELAVGATPRYDSIQHAGIATAMTSAGVASGFFDGVIDEVRVWNYARSGSDILASRFTELTAGTGLVGRWGLDENGGTVVGNSIAGGVNGTAINGPTWVGGFPAGPPAAPDGLAATAVTHTAVQVTWTDNASTETGFEIDRSTTGSGGTFSLHATVGANIASYLDTGVDPNAEYCYRVRAVNVSGGSAYTVPECATTPISSNTGLDLGTGGAYVTMGPAPDLGLSTFTLELWFRRDGTGTTVNTGTGGFYAIPLLTKGRGEAEGSNVDMNWFLGIRGSDNKLAADFEDMAGGVNHPVIGTTTILNDVWYHAAATYDGADWHLYLNGQLEGTVAVGAAPRADSIQHAALGTAMNSTGVASGAFDGVIDEARVWNYARTHAAIRADLNAELSAPQTGLVARWGLNEGAGTVAGDAVAPLVDGTVTGTGFTWVPGAPFNLTFPAPAAPTLLDAAAPAFNRIELLWTDNAYNEDGFEIERSTTGSAGSFTPLASVGVNVASYTDNAVVESSEYCYRVRAFNLTGPSGFADVDCATTPAEGETALDLGTAGAYVTFGPAPALGLPQFTLELWFRRDGAGVIANTGNGGFDAVPLLTKGRGEAEGSNVDMNWFLGIRNDGVLAADFEDMAAGVNHPVAGSTVIQSGLWYHAAATYDGTTWRLYLNGELDGEAAVGLAPRSDSIQHAALATAMNSTGVAVGAFDGVIDEARVWARARTENEIRAAINLELATPVADLVARWGLNEGSGAIVLDSVVPIVDGTIVGAGYTWPVGAPFDIVFNEAPEAPTLVAPTDLAVGVGLSPNLEVTVSDPESAALTVTYYGRPAAEAPEADFTIVGLPDTQFYSQTYNATFHDQTQWAVDNLATRNIVFVTQLGDCVQNGDNGGNNVEWLVADAAMARLETVLPPDGIPFGIAVGNHDQSPIADPDGTTTFYNQFFGEARFAGRGYYGGHYGTNNDNHYQLFSAGTLDFVIVHLEYDTTPDAPILAWAHDVLTTYSARRAIVVTHHLLGTGNPGTFSTQGAAIYNALKDMPNLFLMLGGHVSGEGRRTDVFGGNTVHSLLSDYQSRANGGSGYLRVMEFSPANSVIRVKTYSPTLNVWETDADSQFDLPYAMQEGVGWQELGTVSGVASGSSAVLSWPGLIASTDYEWYVTVSDGISTVTGPVWSFTTGSGASGTPERGLPSVSVLHAAAPNPFNPRTTIAFDIARGGHVRVNVYSVDGRLVATLADEFMAPGSHARLWQGLDHAGRAVASGSYVIKLEAPDLVQTRRMTLLR